MSNDTPTPERVTLSDEEWGVLHQQWRAFKDHRPVGAYLPTGQLDGDCGGCGESWPCAPVATTLATILAAREQALREEIGEPHAYGVEVLVNAGTASAYWQLEDEEGPRDTEEDAEDVRDMMLAEGYRLDHLRVVALTVQGGAR